MDEVTRGMSLAPSLRIVQQYRALEPGRASGLASATATVHAFFLNAFANIVRNLFISLAGWIFSISNPV